MCHLPKTTAMDVFLLVQNKLKHCIENTFKFLFATHGLMGLHGQ